MRKLLFVALFAFFIVGCKKEDIPPGKTDLLTANVWIFDECYTYYGTLRQTLMYKRGASDNIAEWGDAKYIFRKDGSFEIKDDLGSTTGNWKLINDETEIQAVFDTPSWDMNGQMQNTTTHIWVIAHLSKERFEWHYRTNVTQNFMIPE